MSLMITRMLSVFLSLSLLCNPIYAQESQTEETFVADFTWEPGRNETSLGDYELVVYIMPVARMETPHAGYLLYRSDWREIKRQMDNFSLEHERIRTTERQTCDGLLAQKDADCIELNRDLRTQIDTQNTQIIQLNTNVSDLRSDVFWWKVGAGGAAVLAFSFGLFALSK